MASEAHVLAEELAFLPSAWFLAYAKPRQERVAEEQLLRQGFEVYLPIYKKLKRGPQGPTAVHEPMFPRYLFVRPGRPGQGLSTIHATRGVTHLVRFGFKPARVPEALVETIRQMEQEREAADMQALSNLKPGQRVRLTHVALHEAEGLVQAVSSKRVQVLLEILGREVVVKVNHHQVRPVA